MINGQLVTTRRSFTLGADPEMFVFSGNKLLPAFEFLPSEAGGMNMYWDGFQAEWKYTHDANRCLNNLVYHTRENLQLLNAKALKHDAKANLTLRNVVRVPNDLLEKSEMQHVELGCMPSYNAYGFHGEHVPDPRKLKFRFAGGHMHFGSWTRRPQYKRIVAVLDQILGVWSVGAARHLDNSVRRQYYGLPGEYRKPRYKNLVNPYPRYIAMATEIEPEYQEAYGLEYRVLSNFWLASPALMQLTWDLARMCVRIAQSHKYADLWVSTQDETVDVIKNCDYDRASKIITRNLPMFNWILSQLYRRENAKTMAVNVAKQGLEIMVPNPEAVPQNWHFGDQWIEDAQQPWARWETACAQ